MKKADSYKELLRAFLYGILFPTFIIYLMAFLGVISFDSSGWILPGVIIITGGILIIAGIYLIKRICKR